MSAARRGECETTFRRGDGSTIPVRLHLLGNKAAKQSELYCFVLDGAIDRAGDGELIEIAEREYQRWGHELHDSLGQHLHAVYYLAALLQKKLRQRALEESKELKRLGVLLHEAVQLTRSLARGLQPISPDSQTLPEALRRLVADTRKLYRVQCELRLGDNVSISNFATANHIYRIVQECLCNAIRHGHARRIFVSLRASGRHLTVRVQDNGRGLRDSPTASGIGLSIMRSRARELDGKLIVRQRRQGGTEISCTIPLEPGVN